MRALVRTSTYVDVPSGVWRFAAGARSKSILENQGGLPPLHFNLSSAYGLVICAVSRMHDSVGVDIGRIDREEERWLAWPIAISPQSKFERCTRFRLNFRQGVSFAIGL